MPSSGGVTVRGLGGEIVAENLQVPVGITAENLMLMLHLNLLTRLLVGVDIFEKNDMLPIEPGGGEGLKKCFNRCSREERR